MPFPVSPQLVLWATSSLSLAPIPALCVRPTAEPARRDRVCANVAVAFIVQPTMPTLPPAQVSLVCLFVYAQLSWRCARGPLESNCGNDQVTITKSILFYGLHLQKTNLRSIKELFSLKKCITVKLFYNLLSITFIQE